MTVMTDSMPARSSLHLLATNSCTYVCAIAAIVSGWIFSGARTGGDYGWSAVFGLLSIAALFALLADVDKADAALREAPDGTGAP